MCCLRINWRKHSMQRTHLTLIYQTRLEQHNEGLKLEQAHVHGDGTNGRTTGIDQNVIAQLAATAAAKQQMNREGMHGPPPQMNRSLNSGSGRNLALLNT
eukprot:1152410_1